MGFFDRMNQIVAKYRIGIRMKKWSWSPFALMVFVLQNTWVLPRINKDEGDESLPPLAFCRNDANAIFLKIFKEMQTILEPCRNSECLIRCLL